MPDLVLKKRLQPFLEPLFSVLTSMGDRCEVKVRYSPVHNLDAFDAMVLEARPGIFRAAAQYGVEPRILDLCTFDVTNNPWRCGGIFDAIVTDPPCMIKCL